MRRTMNLSVAGLVLAAGLAGCGGSDESAAEAGSSTDSAPTEAATTPDVGDLTGIRLVSPAQGKDILDAPPDDLVVLDVRTPAEFDEGHLPGAVLIDFYEDDFADQLAELDPDVPYLLYCRSGNRSGQTRDILDDLGFTDVADIEGGLTAWANAGIPFTARHEL